MATVKKPLIGVDNFYYAVLNTDTTASLSYQTPVKLGGAIGISINPNSNVATLFADDGPYDTAETIGEIEVDVNIADISQEDYAVLMGHTITGGVMHELATDQPPDVAFGFRAKRSNNGNSYIWLLKGKFSKPSIEHQTKGDAINFQTPTMTGKFVQRVYDGRFKSSTRDDAGDYTASIGSGWFSAVYGVTADSTSPTFSSSIPSASGTSATQTTDITLTFSEALLSSTITAANLSIVEATSSTTIPVATFALSTGGETITLTQSSFTASTSYIVVMGTGLKDEAGNSLTGSASVRFTTSA